MQVHEYDDKDKKRIVKSKIRKSNEDTNTNYYSNSKIYRYNLA
ncbi:MAG: hypothetical protein ACJ719_07875 [Nitrososphaeraceae archaeon]